MDCKAFQQSFSIFVIFIIKVKILFLGLAHLSFRLSIVYNMEHTESFPKK